jgi:hypothetical protein
MAPIVKDSDAAVSAATPNSQAAPASKPAGDAAPRVQPVALEVPVTINGARTLEGSDKREPFSENTQTVLVFPQGAVIRLAASLAPGQLVFLTNEKSKKEVVCQVVKSKNYRTVTGYVELEFTEAAAGFWGMRFPTVAAAPSVGAPTTPKPAAQPTQNATPARPAVLPAPVIKTETQTPVAPKTIAPPPAPPRPAAVPPVPQAHASTPASTQATVQIPSIVPPPVEAKIDTKSQTPAVDNAPAAPSLPLPAIPDLSDFLTAAPGSAVPLKPVTHEESSAATTEELKQQAAKLQEQLSAMLFSEKSKASAASPVHPLPNRNTQPRKQPVKFWNWRIWLRSVRRLLRHITRFPKSLPSCTNRVPVHSTRKRCKFLRGSRRLPITPKRNRRPLRLRTNQPHTPSRLRLKLIRKTLLP